VDNSLIAIVVLAMIVWEFIQRTIPEKAHRDNASHGTDDAIREASFEEPKNTLLSSDDNVKPQGEDVLRNLP
jgi:hypothetical protein